MTRELQALGILAEDLVFIPSMWFSTVYNASSRSLDALFWLPRVPAMHMVDKHTCKKTMYVHNTNTLEKMAWNEA